MYCLPETVRKNGFTYQLMNRTHKDPKEKNVAIYAQLDDERLVSYEVFVIPRRLKEVLTPTKVVLPPSEVFPGDRLFGVSAWSIGKDLQKANKKFDELIIEVNQLKT